jgi:putative SOS response-associated peptidase YedK
LPTFRAAHAKRRCTLPIESFFEWRAIKGSRAKQPYSIAMKDRAPFAIAGLLGELASTTKWRVDSHLCHHHSAGERSGPGNS